MPRLAVQMGHVDRRTGATGTTGEQDFARAAADAIRNVIHGRNGWEVVVLYADVPDSAYRGFDVFVGVHCDGSTSATARGASIGHQNTAGRDLGVRFLRAYEDHGWTGGFRPANYTPSLGGYYGVRKAIAAGCPRSFILEAGFLTNREGAAPTDRQLLTSSSGPLRVAYALADALGVTTATTPPAPPEDDMPSLDDIAQAVAGFEVPDLAAEPGPDGKYPTRSWVSQTQQSRRHDALDLARGARIEAMVSELVKRSPQETARLIAASLAPLVIDSVVEALADENGVDEEAIAADVVARLGSKLAAT